MVIQNRVKSYSEGFLLLKKYNMITHKYLVATSILFMVPSILFYSRENMLYKTIGILLFITTIISFNFWNDGRKNTYKHKRDALWVRILVALLTIIYILNVSKQNNIFILFCLLLLSCLFYSDYFSNIYWCSEKHLISHLCLHIIFIAMLITYYFI